MTNWVNLHDLKPIIPVFRFKLGRILDRASFTWCELVAASLLGHTKR